jgi:hypothetical protein
MAELDGRGKVQGARDASSTRVRRSSAWLFGQSGHLVDAVVFAVLQHVGDVNDTGATYDV